MDLPVARPGQTNPRREAGRLPQNGGGTREAARCLRRTLRLEVPVVALRVPRLVIAHPALRATDGPGSLQHLEALAPSAEEPAAADAALAEATPHTLAAQGLAAD